MSDHVDNVLFLCTGNSAFTNLPLASNARMALNSKREGIGAMDGTTTKSSKAA
jgi:arsenate reductase